jgi:HEAT repeat protein
MTGMPRHTILSFAFLAAAPIAAQVPPTPPAARPTPAPQPGAAAPVQRPHPPAPPARARQVEELAERARELSSLMAERAREMAELSGERAREQAERAREQAERAREQAERAREQSALVAEQAREHARIEAERARERALEFSLQGRGRIAPVPPLAPEPWLPSLPPEPPFPYIPVPPSSPWLQGFALRSLPERPPAPWAQGDPADSLYRAAYELMNKGDYRRAAALFKDVPVRFQYSAYAAEAMYWQAHALYRLGSTPDLQEALQVLERLKEKYPSARMRSGHADVKELRVRIAGVLSQRGRGGDEIVRRALTEAQDVCDSEEQQVRAAALNALMQTDPDAAVPLAQKMLAKRDDCSRELRRSAVFLLGNKRDPQSVATLVSVAKGDPSLDVRSSAIEYLGRIPGDESFRALDELARTSNEERIQQVAVRALARHADPRARSGIKALVERNDVNESLRITALDALDPERSTAEDVAWLQSLYGKVQSPRLRSRIINAMARIGGSQNERWFMTLANNENESIEVRREALRRAGPSMDIAALGRLYDQTGQRDIRQEIVRQLGERREGESIDKLADIIRNGTDPQVRQSAVRALANKKDPRAQKALMELLDKPERE